MNYYSVPSDFQKKTIDRYVELNKKYPNSNVIETYGNITIGNNYGCGRSISQLPKVTFLELEEFINYSKENNIEFNYTFNASHMMNKEYTKEGIVSIKKIMYKLYDAGVRNLTLALPSIFELVNSLNLDFKIKASAICSIDNANIALSFKKMGVDRAVIKELINRDFGTLKSIKSAFGDKIELIVNTPCHMDCSYRMFHYNQQAFDSITSTNDISFNYYEHKCMQRRHESIGNWLKICWIRPEDIKHYTHLGINFFKLQGRQTIIKDSNIPKVVEAYFQESYDGNLVDLINCFAPMNSFNVYIDNKSLDGFLKPFIDKDNFCVRNCIQCNYCDVFAEKNCNSEENKEHNEMGVKFYKEYDEYNHLISKTDYIQTVNLKNKSKLEDIGDFDF